MIVRVTPRNLEVIHPIAKSLVPVAGGLVNGVRFATTSTKKQQTGNISQVSIKSIATIADFYIPPKLTTCPISWWPRLILRRLGVIGINTYSVAKFKGDTKLKFKFNVWKEQAMEKFVKTNKLFAAACSLPLQQRESYLKLQLENTTGALVAQKLIERAKSFPSHGKLQWELIKVEKNPKVVSFVGLPDNNNITTYIQMIIKVRTKQRVSLINGKNTNTTERLVQDYLVCTLNPYQDELVVVGTVFESDYKRGVNPEISFNDTKTMLAYQQQCADIFRSKP